MRDKRKVLSSGHNDVIKVNNTELERNRGQSTSEVFFFGSNIIREH